MRRVGAYGRRLFVLSALLLAAFSTTALSAGGPGKWSLTGSLNVPRGIGAATLLANGKVLVEGGSGGAPVVNALASAELYDPATGAWTLTGSMAGARAAQTATPLLDGRVLVAGGEDTSGFHLASAEIYNPVTGTWSSAGSMHFARIFHSAARLPTGEVLVTGGCCDGLGARLSSAELYDPVTNSWTLTGNMATGRAFTTLSVLATGKALVAGGSIDSGNTTVASAELYDPVTGTWSSTGAMATPRFQQTATLMQNGRVLVAGGTDATLVPLDSAELYDPATGTWSTTGTMTTARRLNTATLLLDGRVAVAGGLADSGAQNPVLARAETYDPLSGTWSHAGKLRDARWGHMATLLGNGQVLAVGGIEKSGAFLASAELFQP